MRILFELIKKDVLLFVADKKAMMITFAVPVVIACFLGSVMGGFSTGATAKIDVLVVDEDHSDATKAMIAKLEKSPLINPKPATRDEAQTAVKKGKVSTALIFN